MFLKNYYKAVAISLEGGGSATENKLTKYGGSATKPSNFVDAINRLTPTMCDYSYFASITRMATTISTSYPGIIIGTGDTPPTLDDYCLSGDLITSFTSSVVPTYECNDSGATLTALCTITNSGSKAFTIREVGVFGKAGSSSSASDACLVERTVLDAPLTIDPSGVGQLTYTIKFNYPT